MSISRSAAPRFVSLAVVLTLTFLASTALGFTPSGLLEIHHINVQQGDCTLIIGPDGTTFLIDGGDNGEGNSEIIPYLENEVGLLPADGLDYMLLTHRHADHAGGLDDVINGGYDVQHNIWDNGSPYTSQTVQDFENAAATTTAGPVTEMPLGQTVQLGDGATAKAVVVDGNVLGHGQVSGATSNENDRSVAILIQYKDFDYITGGDMGGGDDDNACTGRVTSQVNVETPLATSLMPGGGASLLTSEGVEALHVNHHGSESSMNSDYMNDLTPAVAVILVGAGQSSSWHHPRIDVVEGVLLAQASCVTADPALVLQTEEGQPTGTYTSYAGYCSGDITIKTTGLTNYMVDGTGEVSQGPDERSSAGLPATIAMDGGIPDTESPVVSVDIPNGGESWEGSTSHDITWTATDNVGVTSIDLYYSTTGAGGSYTEIATGEPNDGVYPWTVPDNPSTNCYVKVVAWDAATNSGEDVSDGAFTITSVGPPEVVVINEIMQNPASVRDNRGEWFEVYNPGAEDVDIENWTIRDNGSDSHLIEHGASLYVPAGGYLVLGKNGNPGQNGGYTADYVYSGFTLGNGADEVILENRVGAIVDEVYYTGSSPWPDPNGKTMELVDAAQDNNVGSNWAEAVARGGTYDGSGTDLGTPGALNSVSGPSDTEPPVIAVTAPDGGETWQAGTGHDITWNATDNVGVTSIDLYYSTTGAGGTYTEIATGEANDGVYPWTVPADPSTNCYVKVVAFDAATNSAEDVSDGAFTIVTGPAIELHVHGLTVENVDKGKGNWLGRASVTVHDQDHATVSGVTVTGDWSGAISQTGNTGTSDGSGIAVIESRKKKNPSGSFCFDVTNLTLSGYTYNSTSDVPQTPPAVCGPSFFASTGPVAYRLQTSAQNPFYPNATIWYSAPRPGPVSLHIYDVQGHLVATLLDWEVVEPGNHGVKWDGYDTNGRRVSSGVYFLYLEAEYESSVNRITLVR
jgi:beta-lactamase superfamily II metal-dependent hydrolase